MQHILRILKIYFAILSAGFSLTQLTESVQGQIFGLGLMLPGAGFLAHADFSTVSGLTHLALAGAGLSVFMGAVAGWFATGNAIAPPLIWLMLAAGAASMTHGHMFAAAPWYVLIFVINSLSVIFMAALFMQRQKAAKRENANAYLAANAPQTAATFQKPSATAPELSPDDLKRMQFLLDRALQPIADFDGFEWLDQFQTAAIRYQINFAGYALSMAQATYLPAFSGYLQEAQKNLILKQTDHRVWRYWALENMWGNLRMNADPVAHENIMYTGFCALQMAMYHKGSGHSDFTRTGSFTLPHPSGQSYVYDLPALITALERETKKSAFHLIACEPNWIYPLCNTIGASAVRAVAPHIWDAQADRFRDSLENEFIDLDGRFIPCRSTYTGLALPNIGGAMPQAMPCFFLNALMPDIALRHWLVLREEIFDGQRLRRKKFWRIDTGNYRFSRAAAYAATALAAAELGDTEIKTLCLQALDEECPTDTTDGGFYRPKASVWAHSVEFFARSCVKDSFRNMILTPSSGSRPHISHAAYNDVAIASAHTFDGGLRALLYPKGMPGHYPITLSGLRTDTPYVCEGSLEKVVTANEQGDITITAPLNGRTEIHIYRKV